MDTGSIEGKEGSLDPIYYNIYFKDYDGTLLYQTSVSEGTIPQYSKSNPTRDKDDNYTYTFSGWNPIIVKAIEDATYTAQYNKTPLPYTISFNLNGGSSTSDIKTIKTDKVTKELFVFDITKPQYAFVGWSYNGILIFDKNGSHITPFIFPFSSCLNS